MRVADVSSNLVALMKALGAAAILWFCLLGLKQWLDLAALATRLIAA